MVITRYLFREIVSILFALSVLLILIYMSHRFMFYLVQAATGLIPAEFILKLLGMKLLSDVMIILPLSFFLAILLALGRLYKDNEITAMAACGMPVPSKTILLLGVLFSLVIASLSLFLAPWAEGQIDKLKREAYSVAELQTISEGQFKEYQNGKGIFYVQSINPETNWMQNVFIQVNLPHKQVIMVAHQAYQEIKEGDLLLILKQGYRYENTYGLLDYVITEFEQHTIQVPTLHTQQNHGENHKAIPTLDLWQREGLAYQAELQWRIALPISVILLAILAVPISRTTPRQGQYAKIFSGILIYLIYQNLLNVGEKWIEKGDVPLWLGIWWVHGLVLVVIFILAYIPVLKLWWLIRQQRQDEQEIKIGNERLQLSQKEIRVGSAKFKVTKGASKK
ncbi:LPS export ABC transporter permease LptF [Candidatus Albibeggiatoa sp. nov. NOAA]|uniref:LPS export ABC transporter permease LptF n=1 Tax=Candidatus Albibeggiatoa sp. nov. NOAA TaxID=3162724 RepID=UPI0032FCCA42|nr:LPS export ABC transporter permease LptF [Thiotrichaceae bacterium]